MKQPSSIELSAIKETWQITHKSILLGRAEAKYLDTNTLLLTGRARERKLLLHKWLQRKGRYHLVPWLNSLSKTTGLVYNKVAIRGQRTRWGSCSSARNINLNYKLLFLQPELVDYIIIHELCHLTHFNHSADFWQLVAKFQPEHRELRKQLKRYRL